MAVEVHERFTVTAGNLPLLLAVMFLGQLPAMIVAAVVGLWGGWRENSRAVVAFNCATFVICAFLASAAFSFLQRRFSISLETVSLSLLAAGAVAAAVYEGLNYLLTSVAGYVKYDISLATYWREGMPAQLLQSLAVVGGLGSLSPRFTRPLGSRRSSCFSFPLFASQYMFKLLVRERAHVAKQQSSRDKYLEMNLGLAWRWWCSSTARISTRPTTPPQWRCTVATWPWPRAWARTKPRRSISPAFCTIWARSVRPTRSCARIRLSTKTSGVHPPASREGRRGPFASGRLSERGRHRALPPRAARRQRLSAAASVRVDPSRPARCSPSPTPTTP